MRKKRSASEIFKEIERIANFIPIPFYWLDTNGIVLGVNDLTCMVLGGMNTRDKIVGKDHYNFYPKDVADTLVENNKKVIEFGQIIEFEEQTVDINTGTIKYFTSIRSPLKNDEGEIIGIVGTSIEITAEKEAERLMLENERLAFENKIHKISSEEQSKFKKVVDQVSHDIRSPLASILIFAKTAKHLPEEDRILLRDAATRITDIANNLIARYEPKADSSDAYISSEHDIKEPLLVSTAITQILSEKRLQFKELKVKFDHDFSQDGTFAFISVEDNAFKRTLSNLINNSVEALEGKKSGIVGIKLECDDRQLKLIIEDNGKGMSRDVADKIMNNIAVTSGKVDGNGIGLTQVRETLQRNDGVLEIDSVVGKGTKITLIFPRVISPDWFAESINLHQGDLVVVLDDDPSIHGAWRARFTNDAPDFEIKDFTDGIAAIDFINKKTPEEKQKIFLLSDFELLEQEVHGLQVIERTGIKRSVLVTSHHNNKEVRDMAKQTNTRILPKSLAVEVPIIIKSDLKQEIDVDTTPVDLVIVDDDTKLAENLKRAFFSGKNVDIWGNPLEFLAEFKKYPLDTKICLDNNFKGFDINGFNLAEELHNAGFSRLYLISGDKFDKSELPAYLSFILKTDIDSLEKLRN